MLNNVILNIPLFTPNIMGCGNDPHRMLFGSPCFRAVVTVHKAEAIILRCRIASSQTFLANTLLCN